MIVSFTLLEINKINILIKEIKHFLNRCFLFFSKHLQTFFSPICCF